MFKAFSLQFGEPTSQVREWQKPIIQDAARPQNPELQNKTLNPKPQIPSTFSPKHSKDPKP